MKIPDQRMSFGAIRGVATALVWPLWLILHGVTLWFEFLAEREIRAAMLEARKRKLVVWCLFSDAERPVYGDSHRRQ